MLEIERFIPGVIWFTLGSYIPVDMLLFFNFCHREKKPFEISSFRVVTTPRVWDSGTYRNNNGKPSLMSPRETTQSEPNPEPTDENNHKPAKKPKALSLSQSVKLFSIHTLPST